MPRREVVGIGLVVVGLTVHFWNARRDARPVSLAEAVTADPARVDPGLQGKLVAVTGKLETEQTLGDPRYLLPERWIRLTRTVEMFCWTENLDTGQPRYRFGWTESPQAWREFRQRNAHQNPAMTFWSEDWRQQASRIGPYVVNPDAARLPAGSPVPLRADQLLSTSEPDPATLPPAELARRMARLVPPRERIDGDYLYLGFGGLEVPQFGDIRVSWRGIASGQLYTAIGEQRGDEIVAHITDAGQTLWSVAPGERGQVAPRPATQRWGIGGLAALVVLAGLLICLGWAPLALVGGVLAQGGAVLAFFLWPMPAALLAAVGLAAAALTRLGPR